MININMLTVTAFQEYTYNKIVNLLGLIKQEHALFQDVKMPMILDVLCAKEGSVFYLMDLVKKERQKGASYIHRMVFAKHAKGHSLYNHQPGFVYLLDA